MAEALFLSSQKARTDALQRHRQESDTATRFHVVRKELRELKERLDKDDIDETDTNSIEHARYTLRTLRTEITTHMAHDDTIHVSDLRWIHRELSDCQERLAAKTKFHRPKFTFKRYHAALQNHEGKSNASVITPPDVTILPVASIQPCDTSDTDKRRLSGFDSAELRLAEDGKLYVDGVVQAREIKYDAIILGDITSCTIHLNGVYPSLHLHSVLNSTVHCSRDATSIHVTACRHTHLDLTKVQQIRLHDCSHVQIRVETCTAGIILENCTQMRFMVADETVAIHDFFWLRRDAPSPNFTVEYQHERRPQRNIERSAEVVPVPAVLATPTPLCTHAEDKVTQNQLTAKIVDVDGESDDDDDYEL